MIQIKDSFTQSIDMIEARLSRLKNMYKNKQMLPTQFLTIFDTFSHINGNQESWYLEDYDQNSISSQNFELDQYQAINKLVSFQFNEIEHEDEWNTNSQCCYSVSHFEYMLTPYPYPIWTQFRSQHWFLFL